MERGKLKFDYAIECYIPAAKRKYGYFCLPVLWGERFVGRMDAKAERRKGELRLKNVVFETGFSDYDGVPPQFRSTLLEFAVMNGCEEIQVERVEPKRLKLPLDKAISLQRSGRRVI